MREKIAEIMADLRDISFNDGTCDCDDGKVRTDTISRFTDKILSLIHSEMVGLIPAEKRVSKLGNLAENDRNEGYNLLRSELLSAIEKKFGEAL